MMEKICNSRKANLHERLCDECNQPMIGIMKISDMPPFSIAPRKVCYECCKENEKAA